MKKIKILLGAIISILLMIAISVTVHAEEKVYTDGCYSYVVGSFGAIITDVDENVSGTIFLPEYLVSDEGVRYQIEKVKEGVFSNCGLITGVEISNYYFDAIHNPWEGAFKSLSNIKALRLAEPFGITEAVEEIFALEGEAFIAHCDIVEDETGIRPTTNQELVDYYYGLYNKELKDPYYIDYRLVEYIRDVENFCSESGLNYIEEYVSDADDILFRTKDGILYTRNDTQLTETVDVFHEVLVACPKRKVSKEVVTEKVDRIIEDAFRDCSYIEKVVVAEGITEIRTKAFCDSGICEIKLPKSMKDIAQDAFMDCTNLQTINIPEGMSVIAPAMFLNCSKLKSITILDNIEAIGEYAFGYNVNVIDYEITKTQGFTIYGYGNTPAEDYADANNFIFVDLNGHTHSYRTIEETKLTCVTDGKIVQQCNNCGRKRQFIEKAVGHVEVGVSEIQASCENNGKTEGISCSICNKVLSGQIVIYATGHHDNNDDGYCDDCNHNINPNRNCSCNCHKSGIVNFFWKILNFFQKLFGMNKTCACGAAH